MGRSKRLWDKLLVVQLFFDEPLGFVDEPLGFEKFIRRFFFFEPKIAESALPYYDSITELVRWSLVE